MGLGAPPLWPRRSSLSPRRSWFGFGCSCIGSYLSCEVVLDPLPSDPDKLSRVNLMKSKVWPLSARIMIKLSSKHALG